MNYLSRKSRPRGAILLLASGCLLLAGCNSRLGKMAPVTGKVTVGGKLVPSGQVVYAPEKNLGGAIVSGKIENGTYTLMTEGKEGAPLGKYKVFVTTTMPGSQAKAMPINPKYRSAATSGLTKEVVADPAPEAYDLKLNK